MSLIFPHHRPQQHLYLFMPKKHNRSLFPKPVTPAHHTLASSGLVQNGRVQASASSSESSSVNELISHLRRTQVSSPSPEDGTPARSPRAFVSSRSVHPSLRNLLELPETPPPRPRPNARRTGVGRLRRVAGPPPPESWLAGVPPQGDENRSELVAANSERVIYRLERLPGTVFPHGLVHAVLKTMALNWSWHLEYDGMFLAEIPTHLKVLLLSYIAVYARDQTLKGRMRGLRPLFVPPSDPGRVADETWVVDSGPDADAGISRLDLGGALGRWMSFKQLTGELLVSVKPDAVRSPPESEETIPTSWDEEVDHDTSPSPSTPSLPKTTLSHGLRVDNLRYLSLAHPDPASASWNSLLYLLSRLSTITHLSLAHWPTPTRTPNAVNARIRHPLHRSLTFSYSGTDTYAAMDNNWAEATGLLRQLSRSTYCLKWLDLEGCADWLPALTWTGTGPDGQPYPRGTSGPEWNASWRDVEWVGLGPGWIPDFGDETNPSRQTPPLDDAVRPSRSLAASVHSPLQDSESSYLPWDVDEERIRYRRAKELEAYRDAVRTAVTVHSHILQTRRDGRGKWIHYSLGIDDLEPELLHRMLGPEYARVFA